MDKEARIARFMNTVVICATLIFITIYGINIKFTVCNGKEGFRVDQRIDSHVMQKQDYAYHTWDLK